ncbi:MAG: thioredoxin family protein [Candidatus Thorarchaeota archaeon]
MAKELTDETINEFLSKHEVVILDIYTTWCGPCVLQAKILDDLGKGLDTKRVIIAKIDADQAPVTSQKYGVRAIPTLILFQNGEPVNNFVNIMYIM